MCSCNSTLLKQLNEYKKSHTEDPSSVTSFKDDNRIIIIKLINFEFFPKKVKIPQGTLVRWEIGPNQSSYSSIYSTKERCFFISIEELDIQSHQLFPGSNFEYRFMTEGIYEIVCLNYVRVKSIITVVSDNKSNEIIDNSKSLPIYYNVKLKVCDKWKEKKKEELLNKKKSYLNDFPNEFFNLIDKENDFQDLEKEKDLKKQNPESENLLFENQKKIDFEDIKEEVLRKENIEKNTSETQINQIFNDILLEHEKKIESQDLNFQKYLNTNKIGNHNILKNEEKIGTEFVQENSDLTKLLINPVMSKIKEVNLTLELEFDKFMIYDEKQKELFDRVKYFLEVRHELNAFFCIKR